VTIRYLKHCRSLPTLGDGHRILVMRYWPRGMKREAFDEWLRELAPSPALLQKAKSIGSLTDCVSTDNVSWAAAYRAEMRLQTASIDLLRKRHERGETLTLLCGCHDPSECHRSILADILVSQPAATL
jgi:uncharacterized protein YeaO (DUF488 family)